MNPVPLNALRAFEAVARTGSIKAAAGTLFVTPSAVSHQMRNLEVLLGAPLFDRSGARPRLLPEGVALAQSLASAFAEIDRACAAVGGDRKSHPLVVAAIPSVAMCWLIPRLAAFRAAHPEVNLRIIYAMHGRDIDFRDVHLAFVFGETPPARPGIRAEPFLPGRAVPVCAPRLAPDTAFAPADAVRRILSLGLLHDTDQTGWARWLAQAGHDGPPPDGPVFEDFNLLRGAALEGQGVALCPLAMVAGDLSAGRLVQMSDLTAGEGDRYWLLSAPIADPAQAAQARAFHDWAFAALAD